jgi:hypothetical protein
VGKSDRQLFSLQMDGVIGISAFFLSSDKVSDPQGLSAKEGQIIIIIFILFTATTASSELSVLVKRFLFSFSQVALY